MAKEKEVRKITLGLILSWVLGILFIIFQTLIIYLKSSMLVQLIMGG